MKKFIFASFLLLTGVAQAVPYTSQTDHFTADFPGPITTITDKGMRGYSWQDHSLKLKAVCGVAVFTGKEQLNRYDTFKKIKKSDAKISLNAKESMFGKVPGLEIQGIDENGVPVQGRIFAAKHATYVVLGANFDMGLAQKFVKSFHLMEDAPKTTPKKTVPKKK